jgi:phage terminase large subunit-like protein
MSYNSWKDIKPQEGKQGLAFSLLGKVDFMLWGGSRFGGKSELLTMIPLPFYKDPNFRGIYFRRTYKEIMQSNGLWDKANSMYPLFNGAGTPSSNTWKFPSGCRVQYSHMYHERDKEDHRGSGATLIAFDEIDKFSQSQVSFMMTCLRSEAKADSFMVGTLNPSPDSWCLPWVEYYLNDEGFPADDKVGVIRYFVIKDNEVIFGDTEEWFIENHRDAVYVPDPTSEEGERYVRPKTFTFVFFNIFDNPLGLKANPAYLSELNNLEDHERNTQLYGNWYSRPKGSSLWKREWVLGEDGEKAKKITDIPTDVKRYRAWDKAYTEPSKENPQVDYTAASPEILKDKDGFFWIIGNYAPSNYDPEYEGKPDSDKIYGRFRRLAGARDNLILSQALYDGDDTTVILTKDSGSGLTDHTYTVGKLIGEGVNVTEDKSPSNTPDKKMKDFQPFCNACSSGLVYIVPDSFPNAKTLEAWLKEHENFDPNKKSTTARKDDWVDATGTAFNTVAQSKVLVTPKYHSLSNYKTLASDLLSSRRF